MFGNYLAAALRNLMRNRLYAGVTIAGLAIGFAAAILIGLFVRDEYSYDRFVPQGDRIYRISQTVAVGASKPVNTDFTPMMLAAPLKAAFPEVERAARLTAAYFPPTVRHGEIVAGEQAFFWADPDFFRIFALPTVAGQLQDALDMPGSLVVTRNVARKYFGRDDPVGQTLLVDGQSMRITAVIENLPSNTHLTAEIFGSSRSPQSPISQYESLNNALSATLATYVRLRPGVSPATLEARFPAFLDQHLPVGALDSLNGQTVKRDMRLVPLRQIHLRPSDQGAFKPASNPAVVLAIGVVGVLIVAVAAINFVTLMTARAARRAVEVGVRKAAGASRRDLIVQFMGEAGMYVVFSAVLAIALAELALPAFNAFLQRKITFDYLGDAQLAFGILAMLLVTGLLAGVYPALVLSGFRPAAVLKGGPLQSAGGGRLREALVVVQFAVLIALTVVAITITRQTMFSLNEGMRVDKDQVVLVFSRPCSERLRDQMRTMRGVRHAACASAGALSLAELHDTVSVNGRHAEMSLGPIDFDFFETLGVAPVAGRLFDRARPADGELDSPTHNPPVVLNETAVRRLGFSSPQQAIGATIVWRGNWDESQRGVVSVPPPKPSEVIGVVRDFTLGSMRSTIPPTVYAISRNLPPNSVALVAKLDGAYMPETLPAIQRAWKQVGGGEPLLQVFLDQFTLRLYLDTIIQGVTIALAAVIALSIASLGLFALSAYATERRTKEIGIRKAMGASSRDVLQLLMWQFTKPVLWANLIALPAAFLLMNWWLQGFAYRVDQSPLTFAAAAAGAILIAWLTIFVHALRVARARPVGALRYE